MMHFKMSEGFLKDNPNFKKFIRNAEKLRNDLNSGRDVATSRK